MYFGCIVGLHCSRTNTGSDQLALTTMSQDADKRTVTGYVAVANPLRMSSVTTGYTEKTMSEVQSEKRLFTVKLGYTLRVLGAGSSSLVLQLIKLQ